MFASESISVGPGAYPVLYRNLMSVGLLGTIYRVGSDAQLINEVVELTLTDTRSFWLYRAVTLGIAGQVDDAKARLGRMLEERPEDDEVKVTLAVALLFGGDPSWSRWLDNVLATSTDQPARSAAYRVLSSMGKSRFTQ